MGEDFAAGGASTGAHVDEVVGGADDVFVVFYYDHGISDVAKAGDGGDEARGI